MTEPRIVGRMSRADRALLDDLIHEAMAGRLTHWELASEAQRQLVSSFVAEVQGGAVLTARKAPNGWRLHWERRHWYGWVSLRHLAEAVGSIPQEAA